MNSPSDDGTDLSREDRALAQQLSALAHPSRVRLLRFLARPAYLEEIARHLRVSRQAALKHMRHLERAGYVTKRPAEREGVPVLEYSLATRGLFLLTGRLELVAAVPSEGQVGNPTVPAEGEASPSLKEPRPLEPALVAVRGPSAGRHFPLPARAGEAILLGRSAKYRVAIPQDPFLSQRHAEVARVGPRLVLTDLRSTNGTYLNGARLPGGEARPIGHGDIVGLGLTLLVVWDTGFAGRP